MKIVLPSKMSFGQAVGYSVAYSLKNSPKSETPGDVKYDIPEYKFLPESVNISEATETLAEEGIVLFNVGQELNGKDRFDFTLIPVAGNDAKIRAINPEIEVWITRLLESILGIDFTGNTYPAGLGKAMTPMSAHYQDMNTHPHIVHAGIGINANIMTIEEVGEELFKETVKSILTLIVFNRKVQHNATKHMRPVEEN